MLNYCFRKLRSVQVTTLHCSAQTTPVHILQKLNQACIIINSNTGRVYRPKESERLILYLKDINLPKLDKWGTSQIISFLQQVITYKGFYDSNLEFVGLEGVQIVCSMNSSTSMGRSSLSPRFTSIVRLCSISYPSKDQLNDIYTAYLKPVLNRLMPKHPIWSQNSKVKLLASTMIEVYSQIKSKFTVDDHSHYLFTPSDLTQWVLSLLRYDMPVTPDNTANHLLEVVSYESMRIFQDRLTSVEAIKQADGILFNNIQSEWSVEVQDALDDSWYVTWGSREPQAAGAPPPIHGKSLGKLTSEYMKDTIDRGLLQYSRECRDLDVLLFKEVFDNVSKIDRVLTRPGGSVLLAGKSGVGRRTASLLVSHMHNLKLITPKMSKGYGLKQFKNDLKSTIQIAGLDGEHTVLLLEDHQFLEPQFLELINSLLASGEVPGLYTSEELEPLLIPIKDLANEAGHRGSLANYFADRIKHYLHVILIMDCTNSNFIINCQSNPAFFKYCSVQWLEQWSRQTMLKIPQMLITKVPREDGSQLRKTAGKQQQQLVKSSNASENVNSHFLALHETCPIEISTPRQYINFVKMYIKIYLTKKNEIETRQNHLQVGIKKINEAKELVAELKSKAGEQSKLLTEKQFEADEALKKITSAMQGATEQKGEMEKLTIKTAEENVILAKRKTAIDAELAIIEPQVKEARSAVGDIKSSDLSEIRALRAPPDVIRDIFEGVLLIMGTLDTSWVSMRNFLGKRGIQEEIQTFDARRITRDIRCQVEDLLKRSKDSFEPKVSIFYFKSKCVIILYCIYI